MQNLTRPALTRSANRAASASAYDSSDAVLAMIEICTAKKESVCVQCPDSISGMRANRYGESTYFQWSSGSTLTALMLTASTSQLLGKILSFLRCSSEKKTMFNQLTNSFTGPTPTATYIFAFRRCSLYSRGSAVRAIVGRWRTHREKPSDGGRLAICA